MSASFEEVVEFCRANRGKHARQTIEIGERALRNHPDPSDPRYAWLQLYIANAYESCGRLSRAIPIHRELLAKASNIDRDIVANANICLSSFFLHHGDFHTSSTFLEAALENLPEGKGLSKIAHVLYNLAWCQSELRQFEAARDNYIRASDICDQVPEKEQLHSQVLISLGILCIDFCHFGEADLHLKRSLRMSERIADALGIANAKAEIGRLKVHYREIDEALRLFDEGIEGFLKLEQESYAAEVMLYKGRLLLDPDMPSPNPDQVLSLFREVLSIGEKLENLLLQHKAHKALSEAYERTGDQALELHHFKQFHELSQAIDSAATQRRIEHLHLLSELNCDRVRHDLLLEKNDELATANVRLERLVDERKELMGLAAHDLKNPLASIITIVELLKEHPCCEQHADVPALVQMLDLSATSARAIIENILEDHRLEQGTFELEPESTDLVRLCREAVLLHQHRSELKGINLRFRCTEDLMIAEVDPFALRQALDNLVSNAVKFCSAGHEVELRLRAGESTEISVADNGPGISEHDQKQLFRRFAKLSNKPTGNESSSGLGLAIVKKLVELNGGTIDCHSALGRGTTFCVRLPTSASVHADKRSTPSH